MSRLRIAAKRASHRKAIDTRRNPGTPGQPDRQGFEYAFGFLDHRHAHRQYTDHLWRNAERVGADLEGDYVNDLFTAEASSFIQRDDARPFFIYLNYTVPHAELRAPEDAMAPVRGRFPEKPFENQKADAKPTGASADVPSLGYRSQPEPFAAFVAMVTRMDRDIGRLAERVRISIHDFDLKRSDEGLRIDFALSLPDAKRDALVEGLLDLEGVRGVRVNE